VDRVTPVVDPGVGIEFMIRWFEFTPEDQWVVLFGIDHSSGERLIAWAPVGHLDLFRTDIERMGARGDLWFGVATRSQRLPAPQRGGVADCSYLPGLFVDVDIAGPGHSLPNLPPTMGAAVELVKRCPFEPDAVVRTGYGLQCLWRFAEALPALDAIGMLASCAVTWQRLAREAGHHIDNVWSLDRVLRLPGTFNWKRVT
jgi:hypothetical protein